MQRFFDSRFGHAFKNSPQTIVSLLILICILLAAALAPWIAPHDPYNLEMLDIMDAELPPIWNEEGSQRFLLGTDELGRDILSTMLYGAWISCVISISAVMLQCALGVFLGIIAGYYGGVIDNFLMRLADIQLSFSTLMVAIIVLALARAAVGVNTYHEIALYLLILIIGVSEWPQFARAARSSAWAEKNKEYVESAKILGLSDMKIMFKHILPNCVSPLSVIATVQLANAIITEATLSFLGLGMPVTKPSLGSLVGHGSEILFSGIWWIVLFPGGLLIVLIFAVNILGDFLRDFANPKIYAE